jgi:uncharacterized coiled-coil protein SlyX
MDDQTISKIDGAENVITGAHNRQQVVNVGSGEPDIHTSTIRLVYELVSDLKKQIDHERNERHEAMNELRKDVAELRKIAHETQAQVREVGERLGSLAVNVGNSVVLTPRHRVAFAAAFVALFSPVPLFYTQVRDLAEIGWQSALVFAAFAYLMSAMIWSYMWWSR